MVGCCGRGVGFRDIVSCVCFLVIIGVGLF